MKKITWFFIFMALENLAANLAHPITPTLIKEIGLPDYMFGLMFAGMAGTNFLFSPFWGKIASYIDSKVVLFIGCIGYGFGQFLFWHGSNVADIMIARCLSGFFVSGAGVCGLTYIVNTSTDEERGTRLTLLATLQTVCASFGYLIGGLLGEISLSLSFGLQVFLLVACGIAFLIFLSGDRREVSAFSAKEMVRDCNPFAAFLAGKTFMTVSFALIFGVVITATFASTAYDQCFNYYIKDQFGMTSAYNGTIKAVIGIISLVANMTLCLYIIRKTRVAKSNCVILLVGTILMACSAATGNLPVFIILTVCYLAVNAISVPVIQSLVSSKASTGNSNIVMGFYNSMKSLGMVLGALVAGFIYEIGPKLPFLVAAVCFGIAFLFALAFARKDAA